MQRNRPHVGLAVALAIAATTSYCLVAQTRSPLLATVHVEAFGPFGSRIPATQLKLRLFTPDGPLNFTEPKQDLTLTRIPYGTYRLLVWDMGGGSGERDLVVNTKDVWARVGLAFPSGNRLGPGGDLTISGDIRPRPRSDADWWVRAEGMYLNAVREGPVQPSGGFSIEGLQMGTYLLEVFEGSILRHVETLEIDLKQPDTRLTISIAPKGGGH